jgi:hypothetical protein
VGGFAGVSLRRLHVGGDLLLHQNRGWASGGWMSDSLVDGNVDSGSQQQWISGNCDWKSWTGSNWNMVFVGVVHPPEDAWPSPPDTQVARTPCECGSRTHGFLSRTAAFAVDAVRQTRATHGHSAPKCSNGSEGEKENSFAFNQESGAPGGTRTPDLLVRSQTLYPTELRAHCHARI